MNHTKTITATLLLFTVVMTLSSTTYALNVEHWKKADAAVDRGIAFLRSTQNPDGSWTPQPGPAITALAVSAMLDQPDIDATDPAVAKAVDYILSHVNADGSIHGGILANYNTSISISALARIDNDPRAAEAVDNAIEFLRTLQWSNQVDPTGNPVTESHPYYGGAGYGKHGRPDMSNTQFMIQAVRDAGLDCKDPIYLRAMMFVSRCQGIESNDLFADKINNDGGFIYATTINKDLIGVPESKANPEMMDQAKAGKPVSSLRTYGSITYAGFKSYLYANLSREDPRVTAAWDWVSNNYHLDRNPGMPEPQKLQGLYYYYMTFGRTLSAFGSTYVTTPEGDRDWANDLINQLVSLQREDGSWVNESDRWMEGDANLVTCYALIALINAMD